MTDQEVNIRAAIAKTLAACAQAGDARKADIYAACFTEDGVLQLGEAISGRKAIHQWMTAPSVLAQPTDRPAGFVSHHLTTCRIDVIGSDAATVRTYWLVMGPSGIDHSGYYDDNFRRVGEDWLIAFRKPRTLWIAQDSLIRAGQAQ